jgi:hypothetical protein
MLFEAADVELSIADLLFEAADAELSIAVMVFEAADAELSIADSLRARVEFRTSEALFSAPNASNAPFAVPAWPADSNPPPKAPPTDPCVRPPRPLSPPAAAAFAPEAAPNPSRSAFATPQKVVAIATEISVLRTFNIFLTSVVD